MKMMLTSDEFTSDMKEMMAAAVNVLALCGWYQECVTNDDPDPKEICADLSLSVFTRLREIQESCEILHLKDGRTCLKFNEELHQNFEKLFSHIHFTRSLCENKEENLHNGFLKAIKEALEENRK